MVVSITSNASAQIAQRNMDISERSSTTALQRVTSGQRVFSAKEDAAAKAISSSLQVDVAALRQAQNNVAQATSMLQIADGALEEISGLLSRMRTLSATAQSDQVSDTERGFIDGEYQLLKEEVTRIAETAEFDNSPLLGGAGQIQILAQGANVDAASGFASMEFNADVVNDLDQFEVQYNANNNLMTMRNTTSGAVESLLVQQPAVGFTNEYNFSTIGVKIELSNAFNDAQNLPPVPAPPTPPAAPTPAESFQVQATATPVGANFTFQVGPSTAAGDRISLNMPIANAGALGIGTTDTQNKFNADQASQLLETAMDNLNTARAEVGASLSRVEFAASNVASIVENTEAARSVMQDADIAKEMTTFTTEQVLLQAGVAMSAQANQKPQQLLALLQ